MVRTPFLLLLVSAELVCLSAFGTQRADDNLKVTLPSDPVRTNVFVRPGPGTNDSKIAQVTSQMLETVHYLQHPFDATISSRFLDHYINTLDPQHIHFLQSDVTEFERYRNELGNLTKRGNTSPAYLIFNRFMQRLEERTLYSTNELTDAGPFTFTDTNRVQLNRKDLPFPKDLAEAHRLWDDRLHYEYLQERLGKESREAVAKLLVSRKTPLQLALIWHSFHQDIVQTLSRRYARTARYFHEWDGEKVLETYLTALAHSYDPRSDYMDKSDLENFSIQMSLSLFGIGATLQSEDGFCKIAELNPSGPAFKSKKLKAKDRIVAVAQTNQEPVDVVDMALNKVVDMIRGPKGTEVRLTVIPADAADSSTRVVISIIRDEIHLEDQQAKARIIDLPNDQGGTNRLGVLDLPSFYQTFPIAGSTDKNEARSATEDIKRLIAKLKQEKVEGIIFDLRRNPGGSLDEAINLSGLFIKDGPVVMTKDFKGRIYPGNDTDSRIQYDGPLILLTSKFSASASEILAGALQDYGRAVVVGDASTHGKGSVQRMSQLAPLLEPQAGNPDENGASLGALKFTTSKFYRASGNSTQLTGVIPDIILPSIDDYLEVGEAYLDNPLPHDVIPTAKFEKLNRVEPYLPELLRRSNARVAASRDYANVKEDIEKVKKALADKTISLNETQRIQEKEEEEAKAKRREEELKSRKESLEIVYEITLKNALQDGLPAPLARTNSVKLAAAGNHPSSILKLAGGNTNIAVIAGAPATNAASASVAASPKAGSPDDEEDVEKLPLVDANLVEAERILIDYVSLLTPRTASINKIR